jgi:hypothetical protein
MNLKQLEALEREQETDSKDVESAVAKAQQQIAAINREHLRAEVVREQERGIREAASAELAARRAKMLERAELAKAGQHQVSREALLRRARFSEDPAADAAIRSARFMTLSKTPTVALLAYLEDAIAAGDVAGAEVVRVEFQSRTDKELELNRRFASLFDRVKVPGADEAATRVRRTIGLAEMANEKLAELAGRGTPMRRLAAFRMMSGQAA